jgi:hypothetical protein
VHAETFVALHSTHAPFALQIDVLPVQSAGLQARHVNDPGSHRGRGGAQSALPVHPTHWPAFGAVGLVWQTGDAPAQATPSSYLLHGRQLGGVVVASQMGIWPTHAPAKFDQMSCTV